ncbi:hypothetical protein [Alicyclobacillus sp. SO9]|uniref:hypothetical protein n=1 Tax=Alicyclobacillus sp. SO9 TaxID=2665646 RepID=UPI0018E9095C|nr:hypothetical protein [Alicyclobacillus sp. SO9]QQE77156.1 hypothetical protein GI364_14380 [Alicyclobacillus sp. SO9]
MTETSKVLIFAFLVTQAVVPALALFTLVSTNTTSLQVFAQVLIVAGVETLAVVISYALWLNRVGVRVPHAVAILLHLVLTAYWFWTLKADGLLYTLVTGYMAVLFWRIYNTERAESLADSNRAAFVVDSVGVFLLSAYYYVWAVPLGGALPRVVSPLFAFLVLGAVLLRTYALWRVERLTFNTRASIPPWVVWAVFAVPFLVAVLLHHSFFRLLQLVGSGIVAVLEPLLAHLPFPSIHRHFALQRHPGLTSPVIKLPHNQPHHAVMPALLWIYIILMGAFIAGALFWVLRRKKPAAKVTVTEETPEPEIVRSSLPGSGKKLFLQTDNPVRLQVQQWLHKQLKKRADVSETMSFRGMVQRSQEHSTQLEHLVEVYEQERYGRNGNAMKRSQEPYSHKHP